MKVGILASHPIQYQAPWFRALAQECELTVYFAHQPTAQEQGQGFGQAFTWDVDLLSGYKSEFLENVSKEPDSGRFNGCDTPSVLIKIGKEQFDAFIVTGWHLKSYWQAIRTCRRLKIPVLVRGDSQLATPRSRLKALLKELIYRKMLKQFSGFLTVGQRNREYLKHYGVPERKMFNAPHFIDNERFAKQAQLAKASRAEIRSSWGVTPEQCVVLFVGKFVPKKRPEDILLAWAALPEPNRVRVVYVGSGELESTLRSQAADLGLRPVFAGFKNQTELPTCYAAAEALTLPSDGGETWGLVVNEAMASGIPAIVSDECGCNPDLITSGVTGYSFRTGDISGLTKGIVELVYRHDSGYDWIPAINQKLSHYNVQACTEGTLNALSELATLTKPLLVPSSTKNRSAP